MKKKDLRRIYCRALNLLDTSERDNAIKERDLEKKARKKIAYEKAELQLAYDILKDQVKRLQSEHDRLLKYIFTFENKINFILFFQNRLTQGLNNPGETLDDSSRSSVEVTTTNLPPPPPINIRLETVIKIAEVQTKFLFKNN